MKSKINYILFLLFVLTIPIQAQVIRTINVSSPGSLSTLMGAEKDLVTDLTLTGTINNADFGTINQMAAIKKVDMANVLIQNGTFLHYLFSNKDFDRFILPNTLTLLGTNFFWYCNIHEGLTLPPQLQTISPGAFAGVTTPFIDFSACQNLESIGYYSFAYANIGNGKVDLSDCTKLTTFTSHAYNSQGAFCLFSGKVILPPNMINLGDYTFVNFSGSIEFAEGLKIIGTNTFHGATITEKVVLPNTLEEIGNNAFTNSKLNEGIILPVSLKRLREGAFIRTTTPFMDFSACRNLEDIYYYAFAYTNIGNGLVDLSNCISLTKCTPQTSLNEGAFTFYAGHVVLPRNMEILPAYFFAKFRGTLELPSTLESIGNYAFNQSTLREIELPTGLSSIGANAFESCTGLSEIISHNTSVPQLGANVFNGVNKNSCELLVPAESLSLYKAAAQWKDFLKINPIESTHPDGYVKGKKGNIFLRINTTGSTGSDFMGYDYDNNRQLGERQPILKTYNTIEIGESVWTTENLRYKTAYNTWMNHSQQSIDQELGVHTIPLNDFEEKFGAFITLMDRLSAYRNNFNVYNQRDGAELQGWDLPTTLDFAQLMGLAPQISDDPIKNIMTFLGVPQQEVPGKTGNEWNGYRNTSGFTMTPLGRRHEREYPNAQYPKLWYSYGRESAFKLKDYPTGMIVFSEIDDAPVRVQEVLTHMCQARYTRNKTDEELGYRLFVDLEKDKVLVKPLSQRCSENLRELANGLTRGVAVRYMNKEEGIVTKSWSEIQQEAEQIRVRIKQLRPEGTNPRQIDLPATDPFRECEFDKPDEYVKGKEGSIFLRINTTSRSGSEFMGYDYDNDRQLGAGQGQPILKTYKTIEIGESVWTTENLRYKTAYNTWMNHSQTSIDEELGENTIPLNDFEEKFGSFITHKDKLTAYRDDFKVYNQRDGVEQQGWDIPSTLDFAQLIGLAPQTGGDPIKNIISFLGVPQQEVPAVSGDHWSGYRNTSGFTMTPLGRRHALEHPTAQYPKLWYHYGRESAFRLKDDITSMIVFSEADNAPIRVHEALTHMCQSRYTRNKTDEELGYRLFVDLENDQVLVTGLDQKCSANMLELAPGLTRGVALRYMKKQEGIIIRSWSEIQAEAEQIRTSIMFLQANGKQIPLPATDPFRECIQEVSVTSVSLNKATLSLEAGKSETLIATVTPENAADKTVSWTSDNESVVTVDQSGIVTAISEGTATITVTTQDGNKTATCRIEVVKPSEGSNPVLSEDQNYIRTTTYMEEAQSYDPNKVLEQIQYFDGLGRPLQTVQIGITPERKSLATYQQYDAFGRESETWLPGVSENSGQFVSLATIETNAPVYYSDTKPFSQPVYEASPLNRVTEQYGPGKDWYEKKASVKTAYLTNNGNDSLRCIQYTVAGTRGEPSLSNSGYYNDGELYVTQIKNEDGHTSYEFKDKLGQVVLTRQIGPDETDVKKDTNYDTYYVYDDYGNLCFVLPPKAADAPSANTNMDDYVYQYRYDERNRCIQKKIPGADWVSFVYDKADRLILSQDGEQRLKNEWTYNKYDDFGRVIITGICTTTASHETLRQKYKEALIVEKKAPLVAYGYTWGALKDEVKNHNGVILINHYDDYEHLLSQSSQFREKFKSKEHVLTTGKIHPIAKGLLVGSRVMITDATGWPTDKKEIVTALYYDEKGRVVQTQSSNHLGGMDSEYVAYNFTGQPLKRLHVHNTGGSNTQELYEYEYDHTGRLKTTMHTLDAGTPVILAQNTYDELGRLQSTSMGNDADNENMQTVYDYNIRSWTTLIDNPLYRQDMDYTLSGNVDWMEWTQNMQAKKRYNFVYDKLSRLTAANYADDNKFSTSYTYDKHGNVKTLKRNGMTSVSQFGTIDNLNFEYNGNRLKSINDGIDFITYNQSIDFKDNEKSADEYSYNQNGAITGNKNKKQTVNYNSLNLPMQMEIDNGTALGVHKYTYAADGRKLKVDYSYTQTRSISPVSGTVSSGGTDIPLVKDYIGNKVYEDGVLRMILLDNGYYDNIENKYYFYVKDHLGNNRIVADASGAVVQSTQYYPFGMTFAEQVGRSLQPYKYNGKELDEMNDLNQYDYSARFYDPAEIRFTTIDPLAEEFYNWSPYVYVENNPLRWVDRDGMKKGDPDEPIEIPEVIVEGKADKTGVTTYYSDRTAIFQFYKMPKARNEMIIEHIPGVGAVNWANLLKNIKNLPNTIKNIGSLLKISKSAGGFSRSFLSSLSRTISTQKQARHIAGTAPEGKGFLNSQSDAQKVLDAVHSGTAQYLGTSSQGHVVVKYTGVTGTNVNLRAGISGQPTNVFLIKGTVSPSVVPTNPGWVAR